MIIDQNAIENLNFSLTNDNDTSSSHDENKVDELIKKYEITANANPLIHSSENNYLFLINHITQLYYYNKTIPDDIQDALKNDIGFKCYLEEDLKRRLNNLISNNSTLFFKEIGNIINLLSLGKPYKIFDTYTKYNLQEVSKLFRDYESLLKQLEDNNELFDLTFNAYIILIDAFTQLCVINSTDIQRKKTINPIIELLTESNNMLKFTVTLSEQKIDELNNILGKLLYYFSHISYYEIKSKTMQYLIEEFTLNLQRQEDGYTLSKETNFGNNIKNKEKEFIKFKSNNSFLLLTLIKKLEENFTNEDFFNHAHFKKLIQEYNNNFSLLVQEKTIDTLENFRQRLLNSLVFNYITYHEEDSTKLDHQEVINNFILAGESFEPSNLETIHNILLFAKDIEPYKYLQIADILTNCDPIQNDYYEFFNIKTLDVIINKFINTTYQENLLEYLEKIFSYVEKNKTASQLLCMFTKIYLSLAHFYSKVYAKDTIVKAKNYYALFVNINGFDSLENEYFQINTEILKNFGKYHTQELHISKQFEDDNDFKLLGKDQINTFLELKEVKLKYVINQEISNLTSQILNENSFDYEDINNKISSFISHRLFYGIASVAIKGLTKKLPTIDDTGYKQYSISIFDSYEILFIFPAVYEETFKYILENNKEYIIQNITNILTGYTKNNILYIDEITHLENITKLKNDLLTVKNDVLLIELSIPSLIYVNKKYGYETGDKFFRAISKKIESFTEHEDKTYRLSGARIGIKLAKNDTYNDLIKKIFNFNITLKGEQIDTDYILAVTRAKKEYILLKSSQNIEEAITLKKPINIKI